MMSVWSGLMKASSISIAKVVAFITEYLLQTEVTLVNDMKKSNVLLR